MKPLYATSADGRTVAFPTDARVVDVDVRDDLRSGREPFGRIMQAVDGLGAGEVLRVRAPFAPVPLLGVLSERGFVYHLEDQAEDDWSVWFWRPDAPAT